VGAATTAACTTSAASSAWRFGRGVAHTGQYLPPLLKEAHAPYSQLEAEGEEAMMGGLWVLVVTVVWGVVHLVVCVLQAPVVLLGLHTFLRPKCGKPWHIKDCWKALDETNQTITFN
jgi:hypothetical protein